MHIRRPVDGHIVSGGLRSKSATWRFTTMYEEPFTFLSEEDVTLVRLRSALLAAPLHAFSVRLSNGKRSLSLAL